MGSHVSAALAWLHAQLAALFTNMAAAPRAVADTLVVVAVAWAVFKITKKISK